MKCNWCDNLAQAGSFCLECAIAVKELEKWENDQDEFTNWVIDQMIGRFDHCSFEVKEHIRSNFTRKVRAVITEEMK